MVEPVLKEDGTPYKVAILIPTINNADELAIVLDRLTQQTYPDIEIVISDSKSRDHTKDVCEKYGATWIEDPSTNRADACNFALKQNSALHRCYDVLLPFRLYLCLMIHRSRFRSYPADCCQRLRLWQTFAQCHQ